MYGNITNKFNGRASQIVHNKSQLHKRMNRIQYHDNPINLCFLCQRNSFINLPREKIIGRTINNSLVHVEVWLLKFNISGSRAW